MLREPLGDPHLRLMFSDPRTGARDGEHPAAPAGSPPGREVTVIEREGTPAVAIFHDPQLDDDPELLEDAGAVALLAAENAEHDAAWSAHSTSCGTHAHA